MTIYILAIDWRDGDGTELECAFRDRSKAVE